LISSCDDSSLFSNGANIRWRYFEAGHGTPVL
jgi:hypothetical protein